MNEEENGCLVDPLVQSLTDEETVAAWNTRPVEDALVEALKRLGTLPPTWGKTSWREGALCWCKVNQNDSDSAKDHSDVCNETRAALKLAGGK
jgi:hypothetical protein